MNDIVMVTYCSVKPTDKINRYDRFHHPLYEINMHISRLEEVEKEHLVQLYQEGARNKIIELIKRYYSQPIIIIYANDSELLGLQGDNGLFIQFNTGKPNNIVILDDIFLIQEVDPNYLYTFIFDHPELITNEEDCELYAETTEQEKEDHLNGVKLILDRFLERYDPKVKVATVDADYIFEYCVDYSGHNCRDPKPYIKYVNRQECFSSNIFSPEI